MGKGKSAGLIEIDFDDGPIMAAFQAAATGVRPRCRTSMEKSGKRLVADMRTRLTKQKKVDTRKLYAAIAHRVNESGDTLTVEVGPRIGDPSVIPYDVVVDEGREAGKKMPPRGVLLGWLQRKGLPESAEYPIRRKIAEEGTPAAPYIDITGDRTVAVLEEIDDVLTFVRQAFGS